MKCTATAFYQVLMMCFTNQAIPIIVCTCILLCVLMYAYRVTQSKLPVSGLAQSKLPVSGLAILQKLTR